MERLKRTEKCGLTERVLQFGEGNFLRGFVDWMFDRLNKEHDGDFGVVVVQPLDKGLINMINDQDGRYTLYLRGLLDGERTEETRIVTGYPRDTAKEMEESYGYYDNIIDTAEIFHLWVIEGDKKIRGGAAFYKYRS